MCTSIGTIVLLSGAGLSASAQDGTPSLKADWNCPTADSDNLPPDWTNVRVDPDVADQDPWGLDGPIGPRTDGVPNVGCEPPDGGPGATGVLGATASTGSTAGRSAVGSSRSATGTAGTSLAVTGPSLALPLAAIGVGLVLVGTGVVWIDPRRRWQSTTDPRVRYTVDFRSGPRK